jgi:type IV pilus assembly protein PilA
MRHGDRTKLIEREAGFSLVELLVVVMVIGILVAIAVPSFLGAQGSAKTKAATSNLRTALSSAKTVQTEEETYLVTDVATTVTKLEAAEPSLVWQEAPATEPEQISVVADTDTAALATRSKDGHCYYVVDDVSSVTGGVTYGKSVAAAADCPADLDTTTPGIAWAETPVAAGW